MAKRRNIKRDRAGRFARVAGAKVATKTAAGKVRKSVTRRVRQSYVKGSFAKNLEVGQGGNYKGVKVGVEFATPAGRGALVKGIAGYHGKRDRRIDVTPKLDKPSRTLTVTARPNPARKPTKAAKPTATASAGSKKRSSPTKKASAGARIR